MIQKDILNVFCLHDEEVELREAEDAVQKEADGLEESNIVAD